MKPPGIFESKPKATSLARPKAKNPRGHRLREFLAEDLAEDVAEGLLERA